MTAQTLSYLIRYLMIPLLVILVWVLLRDALITLRRAMRRTIQPARDVFLLGETRTGTGLLNLPVYSMTTIGRAQSSDIRLRNENIAQRHAMIYLFDGEWFLRPLTRNNPVFINGVRINSPTPLEDQDEITLNDHKLTFMYSPEYTPLMAEQDAWANAAYAYSEKRGSANAYSGTALTPHQTVASQANAQTQPETPAVDYDTPAPAENVEYPAPRKRLPTTSWLLFNILLIASCGVSLLLIPDSITIVTYSIAIWYFAFFLISNFYLLVLPRAFKGLDPVLLLCFLILTMIGLIIQTRLAVPESIMAAENIFGPDFLGRFASELKSIARAIGSVFGGTRPAAQTSIDPALAEHVQTIFSSLNAQYISIAVGMLLLVPTILFIARTHGVELFIPLCAILTPLMLLATLVLGNGADSHGATLWINIGGFSLQLTEFAKITYLIVVAGFFKNRPSRRMQLFFAAWAGFVFFLIMLLPDLGSAMILLPTTLLVYVVMTSEYITTLLLLLGGTGLGALAIAVFPHVQRRLIGWTTLWTEVNDSNRQIVYGLQAMVRGGLLGRGLGNGSPGGIPLASSDMIFSVVCEELGLLTGLSIVVIFIIIWLRGTTITVLAPDGFRSSLALAIGTMLFVEAIIVIGGTTGLIPLTGATLPMIAKGGSSALAKLLMLGILLGLSTQPRQRRVNV